MNVSSVSVVTCFVAAFAPSAALEPNAALRVRAADAQDAPLSGAIVTVSSSTDSYSETDNTDESGTVRFDSLPPGDYRISVALSGFRTHEEIVRLESGQLELRVELAISPFAQRVDVVEVSPGLGSGVDRDRIPATVFVMDEDELGWRRALSLADALQERLGAVALEETTTNPLQPTLRFRGFTASSLLGLPQGVAVYQNGVRINEPFGDTVQFDLIPQFALACVQMSAGAEPAFGLNALGGALALRLKNGFDARGFRGEISGGSLRVSALPSRTPDSTETARRRSSFSKPIAPRCSPTPIRPRTGWRFSKEDSTWHSLPPGLCSSRAFTGIWTGVP